MSSIYTAVATAFDGLVQIPSSKDVITAYSVAVAVRKLADGLKAAAGASSPVITTDGVTLTAVYEIAEGFLKVARLRTFNTARAIMVADSADEYNWTTENTAKVASADEQTTNAGQATLVHNASASDWILGTYTSPRRYRTYQTSWQTRELYARVASNTSVGGQTSGILINSSTSSGTLIRGVLAFNAGAPLAISQISGGGTAGNTVLTVGQAAAGIWFHFVITPEGRSFSRLNLTASATPPTSGWVLGHLGDATFSAGTTLQAGWFCGNDGSAGHTSRLLYWDDSLMGEASPDNGAYDQSGTEIQILDDWDLGPSAPALNQTLVREALVSMVNTLPGDAATWTFSVKQSAAVGAVSGVFAAAGAVVVSGSGRYVSVWAKGVSDGAQAGSLRLPAQLPATV